MPPRKTVFAFSETFRSSERELQLRQKNRDAKPLRLSGKVCRLRTNRASSGWRWTTPNRQSAPATLGIKEREGGYSSNTAKSSFEIISNERYSVLNEPHGASRGCPALCPPVFRRRWPSPFSTSPSHLPMALDTVVPQRIKHSATSVQYTSN